MKWTTPASLIVLALLYTNCTGPASSVDSGAGNEGQAPAATATPTPTPGPALPLPNTKTCTGIGTPCAEINFANAAHTISPLLFGEGVEWSNYGQDIVKPDLTNQTTGTFRTEVVTALKNLALPILRYPGGTLADLFHWQQSVGPMNARTPQKTLDVDSGTNSPKTQMPFFGPDEFVELTKQIGSDILLTVNVGTGTANEAAAWIAYWKQKGVNVKYVEIGNEMYLPGPGNSFGVMTPLAYAQAFNTYAAAIRIVDPTIQIGAIGTSDTVSWCYPNCAVHPWNEIVLTNITQKIDFFALHTCYAPGVSDDTSAVYKSMMTAQKQFRLIFQLVAADIILLANAQSKNMKLALTEHASFFLARTTSDISLIKYDIQRNQNMATAIFSAATFNTLVNDPKLFMANHINPVSPMWQAPINLSFPDFATYPNVYDPVPTRSAYGHVFMAYKEMAGQTMVPVALTNSPVQSSSAVGIIPALSNVNVIDVTAAKASVVGAAGKGWIFLANQSLTDTVTTTVVLRNIPAGVSSVNIDILTATDYLMKNIPVSNPNAIVWSSSQSYSVKPNESGAVSISIPHTSLVRFRLN